MKLAERLLSLLYPVQCVGCGSSGARLCARCQASVSRISAEQCGLCGHPRAPGSRCPHCQGELGDLRGVTAACLYEGVVRDAIHRLKYRGSFDLAPPLASLLLPNLAELPPFQGVAPVPLHWVRERHRGYNQARMLAGELCRHLNLPLLTGLHRTRATPAQVGLTGSRRRANVAHAFTWKGEPLTGMRVLLVDDVATTGATLRANAEALVAAGSSWVWAAVISSAR